MLSLMDPKGGEPYQGGSTGVGMWDMEARRVLLLAAESGLTIDTTSLLYCDMRDLIALRECLRAHLRGSARRVPWSSWRHPCCARAHTLLDLRPVRGGGLERRP